MSCFFEVVVQTQIHCLTNAGVYLRTRNEERDKLVELRTYTSFFQPNLKRVASDVRKMWSIRSLIKSNRR